MTKPDLLAAIKILVDNASKAQDTADAMRLSQAALNLSNALACLSNSALLDPVPPVAQS